MKRTLYLARHAKSSWNDPHLADFERPLNDRGLKTAPQMGEFMRQSKLIPKLIVSSPATRARHTAQLFKEGGSFDAELTFDGRIYEASPRALREVVSEFDDKFESVMLVGHNPGLEGFIRYVSGELQPMPTAAVAVIELDLKHWSRIDADCCTLKGIHRPKELTRS
jgi:phosphohistidine phosphatase